MKSKKINNKTQASKFTRAEPFNSKIQLFEVFLFVIGGGLFVYFLILLKDFFSPFVAFISIVVALYPLRKYDFVKNLLLLSLGLIILWSFYLIGETLLPFIVAFGFAYIFAPLVNRMENFGISRWISSLIVVLLCLFIFIISLILITPLVLTQFQAILNSINQFVAEFTNPISSGRFDEVLNSYGINPENFNKLIKEKFNYYFEDIVSNSLTGTFNLISGFAGVVASLLNLLIIPILIFYFLKDYWLFKNRIKKLFPEKNRELVSNIFKSIDDVLGQYLRGTAIIALFDGLLVSTFFWLIGIQYPIVMGVSSAILYFIPYAGFLIMLGITLLIISLNPVSYFPDYILGITFLLTLHSIENFILTPKIIGKKIGLHPILIILSLFVFGYLFGFLGLLIAIPATAILILLLRKWEELNGQEDGLSTLLEYEEEI